MTISLWLSFVAVALVATFSPGPGVMLAISTTLSLGARRAVYSSTGNAVGVLFVAGVVATGVGLLFRTVPWTFALLKFSGAAYLAYLGVKQWLSAGSGTVGSAAAAPVGSSRWAVFSRGVLVASSNPKAMLFFAAVFPQFMPMDVLDPMRFIVLSLTFVACTFLSHFSYVMLVSLAGPRLLRGVAMVRLQRALGVLLLGLGLAMLWIKPIYPT